MKIPLFSSDDMMGTIYRMLGDMKRVKAGQEIDAVLDRIAKSPEPPEGMTWGECLCAGAKTGKVNYEQTSTKPAKPQVTQRGYGLGVRPKFEVWEQKGYQELRTQFANSAGMQ